jgi:hypothetical protein
LPYVKTGESADPEFRRRRASKAVAASRDPFAKIRRTRDPVLAAELSAYARERAAAILAEGGYPPEVLAEVAAIIGPITVRPKAPAAADEA